MNSNTTPRNPFTRTAHRHDTTSCPVARLAADASRNIAAARRLDIARCHMTPEFWGPFVRNISAADAARAEIERRAFTEKATSGVGAMFQIHLIAGLVKQIENGTNHKGGAPETTVILNLLDSIRSFIATTTGDDPKDAESEFYMPVRKRRRSH